MHRNDPATPLLVDGPSARRSGVRERAYLEARERACLLLLDRGWEPEELCYAQLFDLPIGVDAAVLVRRRADLGLPVDTSSYLLTDETGQRIRTAISSGRQFAAS